jgi:hypothetical protein
MAIFSLIKEEFLEELDSIGALVDMFDQPGTVAKTRVASVNSSVLLLAATFEEFIRQMAKEYARWVVSKATSVEHLPDNFTETAWKRTLESLARAKLKVNGTSVLESISLSSRAKFDAVCGFISGDLTQEVFDDLIHNENNMRTGEVNSLFKVSGLRNVCGRICERDEVKYFFAETEAGIAHGHFIRQNDDFFERRNNIAHSLNASSSVAPDRVRTDIAFFKATGLSLCALLDELTA